jgi:hypothetical protein
MPDFIGPLSHHIHSSTPVPYAHAQKWINAYTARSQQHPHMHPDAQLSRKITFGTNGPSGGVTLTQLRKVARGLGGERVTPEPEELPEGNDTGFEKREFGGAGGEHERKEGAQQDGTRESDWEDADQWAMERDGNEIGEMGERSNYVREVKGGHVPDVEEELRGETENTTAAADKEERKRLKKEKRKAEKQGREAERRKAVEG